MREGIAVGCHPVAGGHRPQSADIFIGPRITHHTNGAHRQQHGKGLPDLVIQTRLANGIQIHCIRSPQDIQLFRGDFARHTDGKAGARERVPSDQAFGKTQLAPKFAHFILEQLTQRFDKLQLHFLWQPAHIVMRLDGYRIAAGRRNALDHIRIQCALRQKGCPFDTVCLFIKHLDEAGTDDLALLFRVGHAGQLTKEHGGRIPMDQRNIVVTAKQRDHLLCLTSAQQPVINKNACQLIANRLMDQHCRH